MKTNKKWMIKKFKEYRKYYKDASVKYASIAAHETNAKLRVAYLKMVVKYTRLANEASERIYLLKQVI